ncbi:MAG: Fur family transcriptional regulator [Anaerolineaceae bacterium]|jgi:Fe2+ or Zn2+ uptake regulation protein|nr:Fur family transcriptional regulator [Anaerolineaceae bacterium]MDD4042744.1 Fur family transcriptional regulator [Anaerolineaceae bacterium]MDD4577849.1 Fur family transcriptional regulator [Anaerolineaceae bacterium]
MDYKAILTQNGYRLSQPRKQVIELLQTSEVALSPQQIHQALQQKNCELGLVSVYRTLELLTELGLVSVVYDPQRNPGYMLSTVGHLHHIVCQECHKAIEFSASNDIDQLVQRVEQETSFQVLDHFLQLFGLCPDCHQKQIAGE